MTTCTEHSVTPQSCEMTNDNLVKVEWKTEDGDTMYMTMSSTALLNFVNMAVQLVNSHTARVMREVSCPV